MLRITIYRTALTLVRQRHLPSNEFGLGSSGQSLRLSGLRNGIIA
jgi:hypothetical protein